MGAAAMTGSPFHVAATLLLVLAAVPGCDRGSAPGGAPDDPVSREPLIGEAPGGSHPGEGLIAFNSASEGGIALLDPATGETERLVEGFSAEWSADGRTLSFLRNARIFLIAPDGTDEREVRVDPFHFEPPYVVRPVLSPDGRRLAYSRQGDLEVLDLERRSVAFLMRTGPEDDRMPAWSPSGRSLAFVRDRDIYVVGADGSAPRNLTNDAADNLDPDWSPDGAWIAFSATHDGDTRVWRIRVDGTDRGRLTADDAPDHQEYHPSWSPDGTEVVFERWGGSALRDADIYAVTVEQGAVRPLVVSPGFDGQPSWGAAGTRSQRRSP